MTHLIFALKKIHTRLHCGTCARLWLCQQLKILSFHSQYRIIPHCKFTEQYFIIIPHCKLDKSIKFSTIKHYFGFQFCSLPLFIFMSPMY